MTRPTEQAKDHFAIATQRAYEAERLLSILKMDKANNKLIQLTDREAGEWKLASAVARIAWGLQHLSTGLRATYILLEEINRKLPK
jgi:hypothetical protein